MALAENRKVHFDYEIIETFSAGMELLGLEVKSLRTHSASLDGSYIVIRGKEAFLLQSSIPPYQPANTPKDYDPLRVRRLLLTRKELEKLRDSESNKGLTIVPLKVYNKGKKVKIDIAIVRGKKKFDKRTSIQKREEVRDMQRTLKYEN